MGKYKLLFVDDEVNILKSLKRQFMDEDYEIYTAENGYKALDLMDENEFSLILSDYRMPELDGVEFLKLAKKKSPDTIRMVLTGYADVDVAISAINEGEVYKFIEKPWEGENLKVQIKRALEHYELLKERKGLIDRIKKQNEELIEWNKKLERRVEEKTKELQKAYNELKLKVKELKGRDKILQFLLTIHTFEEVVEFILKNILDVIEFDKIVLYVADNKSNKMYPEAGFYLRNSKKVKMKDEIKKFPTFNISQIKIDNGEPVKTDSVSNKVNNYTFFVPVEKDNAFLGLILVDNSISKTSITKENLDVLSGFSSLAALAISEHFITSDLPELENKIDSILGEFK